MFIHKKIPLHEVRVDEPNARFGQLLLEQFGGATGELTAGLTYFVQSFHTEDPTLRDMLLDIATEEFGHLEMVGMMIEQHTDKTDQTPAFQSTLFAVRGKGPHFLDSLGSAWSAKYINQGGSPVRDLRANLAAEAGAAQTYQSLVKMAPDEGTRKTLVHLLTREFSHTEMFMKALDKLGKLTNPVFGDVPPDSSVDLYFNLSQPLNGVQSERGPWNEPPTFKYIEDPLAARQQQVAARQKQTGKG